LYINDLPQSVQEPKVVLFPDDTNILLIEKTLTSLQEKIVHVVKQLENWFLSNNLIINTGKTKALLFQENGSSSIHRPSMYLNNKEITYTSNLKFQGIHITCMSEQLHYWAPRTRDLM
jgi:effector-binding domain-containing protein